MDISKWGFQNRNLVYFLVAVLLAGGALACYQMSKLEDPEIKVKLAMVATTYPGASAHQVELEVTDVLEKSIRKMDNVDNVESYSFNDLSPSRTMTWSNIGTFSGGKSTMPPPYFLPELIHRSYKTISARCSACSTH